MAHAAARGTRRSAAKPSTVASSAKPTTTANLAALGARAASMAPAAMEHAALLARFRCDPTALHPVQVVRRRHLRAGYRAFPCDQRRFRVPGAGNPTEQTPPASSAPAVRALAARGNTRRGHRARVDLVQAA